MYNLVGLGKTGCNVVRKLEEQGKYGCFYIDKNLKAKKNHLCLPEYSSPEEYELFSSQRLKNFAKKIRFFRLETSLKYSKSSLKIQRFWGKI